MEDDATGQGTQHGQQDTGISEAVERLAMMLSENGLPRMMARVFAHALVDDSGRYTAAEFATALQVSQAAISGAVRQLVQLGYLDKVREPGSRSDQYRLYDDDIWTAIMLQRMPLIDRWEEAAREVVDQLPPGPGRRRIAETVAFFQFSREETLRLMERWKAHRAQLDLDETTHEPE